jgi:predicted NAD-dependent protein-ADP-ribosyltransferase YbiA (DUF1768 family)
MVLSVLDPTVNYSESAEIDPTDLDHDANLYQTTIYGKDVIFALGKPKYTYVNNNIVYYSIYLVEDDEITMQIGLYEIVANEQEAIVDADGDIDLNKFNKPLLYAFTYKKLHKAEKASIGKASTNISSSIAPKKWIQEFMSSDQYDIIDTKYDGNCFFSMVKLALEENEQEMSIDDMREILADNVTEELFQNYKMLYENYLQNEENLTREIKNITKRHKTLTSTMKKTKDRSLITSYEKQSGQIERMHAELKRERKQVQQDLTEYAFMNGIENLSMMKLKIKTSEYWADTWAVSTLERELNIKLIIFSELNYREKDEVNVLQCGQLNDTILEERGTFEPSFYILAAYHGGYHYQMITYNNQKSFSFEELPEAVRHLVAEKCLEKIAGPYSLIPEFRDYALKQQAAASSPIIISSESRHGSISPIEELSSDLYDNGTVFRFYIKSVDKPLPGKGAGETLGPEGKKAYEELARIPQWRKKLSNFWPAEFKLDNHRWLSVEHYYQAAKFKRNNKDFYIQFSLDSPDSSIAKDAELAKAAGDKTGKFKGELVRPKNVTVDPDFFVVPKGADPGSSRGEIEMESAMRAKFTQHPDLKELLLATKKAKLEGIVRGKPAYVLNHLMRVRRELKDAL